MCLVLWFCEGRLSGCCGDVEEEFVEVLSSCELRRGSREGCVRGVVESVGSRLCKSWVSSTELVLS